MAEHVIRVPASHQEQARELVESFLAGTAQVEPGPQGAEPDDDEPAESRHTGGRRIVAGLLLLPLALAVPMMLLFAGARFLPR